MIPTWLVVVTGISLAILALAALAIAVAQVVMAFELTTLLRQLHQVGGPALSDVRDLVATIRAEADSLVGTSRDLRGRIVSAADQAQARLTDLAALFEVVQEEVETTVLDAAATLRTVRRGFSVIDWGRKALKRRRKR